MDDEDIVIVAAHRTPTGALLGQLSTLSAPDLGAIAHQAAMTTANISPKDIDELISGCVLQAGIGQAPARQAAIKAGINLSAGATTINKMCGSGMKAVMLAHDLIKVGSAQIVVAGGMESMSNAPYLLKKSRSGHRMGHGEFIDHMLFDGLEDAYESGKLMGCFADVTAQHFHISRKQQDDFAIESMSRALAAQQSCAFDEEITPVTIHTRQGEQIIRSDEAPDASKLAKIPNLKPAFNADGTVTAGNSSSIADGAASLILMTYANARARGLKPLARIVAHASHAQAPEWFTTAPVDAIRKVLAKASWQTEDVDLYEINEAFAIVTIMAITQLNLNPQKVNIRGGACALGHPIGASGARIVVTLLHALRQSGLRRGVAALCIGGGEATAIAIEIIHD
jgi:acetyl-CoA C-acetyltransferase